MKNNDWILVTGGCKRVGAYINQQFARQGNNIILHYHQSEAAALQLKKQLQKDTPTDTPTDKVDVVLWQADLNDPESLPNKIESLLTQVGPIKLLINNASVFELGDVATSSIALIQKNMNVHLTSPWVLMQNLSKICPNMQIINILDANLAHKYSSKAAYFIAKKSLETLTELAAIEFAPHIRVNALSPGFVLDAVDADEANKVAPTEANLLEHKVPLQDLFSAIEFLFKNSSITGQIIQVDGGSHLQCPSYMLKN